ncbi:unnamed protein product [Diamesa tonsa]
MNTVEPIDPFIVQALKWLHSSDQNSAEKIRNLLDQEILKNKHPTTKLLSNTLNKKHLNDEKNAPGSGFKKQKPKQLEPKVEVEIKAPIVTPTEPPVTENIVIPIDETDDEDQDNSDDDAMQIDDELDLTDLTCVSCRQMDVSSRNKLVECNECHSLYHQECHVPKIVDLDEQESSWICSFCSAKKEKESASSSSKTSKKSNSSKNYESSGSSTCSSDKSIKKKSTAPSVVPSSEKKAPTTKKKTKESSSSSSSSRSSKK